MKNTNSKGFVPIIIIAFVAVLAIAMVGVGIYFKMQNDKQAKENANTNTNTAAYTNTATDETAGWKTYTNMENGIAFKYPDTFAVRTDDSTDSAVSLNFEGSGKYTGDTIRVVTLPNITGENLDGALAKLKSYLPEDYFNTATVTEITDGKIVYRIETNQIGQYPYAYVVRSTGVWTIAYQNNTGNVALADMETVIKGMTKTFQFTK